ncbi:MAG: ATP-binding protein [Bdellovibrionales bacterium]|nr:ATP-binding protein [Bdellovibrionales bacterium]
MSIKRKFCALLTTEWEPELQTVEVAMPFQLPQFQIIGLAGPEVAEARERIRAAFEESELEFPKRKVVVNLAPARIRKQGTGADLAIALAILERSLQQQDAGAWVAEEVWVASGELGLDGGLRPMNQPLRTLQAAIRHQADAVVFPEAEREKVATYASLLACQGSRIPKIFLIRSLKDADLIFQGQLPPLKPDDSPDLPETRSKDPSQLLEISWMDRTAVGIACAGRHHVLLLGPRGAGKTHLLDWIRFLRPPSATEDVLERASIEEMGTPGSVDPFVYVSPTVRPSALIGSFQSGKWTPGALSRANRGVLVADEFAEWSRDSRETLREPLENGMISLTRTGGHLRIPSRFQWLGTSNLCPCGGWPIEIQVPDHLKSAKLPTCYCPKTSRDSYRQRISGPVIDRIDILWFMAAGLGKNSEKSHESEKRAHALAAQVRDCRARLIRSYSKLPSEMSPKEIQSWVEAHPEIFQFEEETNETETLSFRRRHKWARLTLSASAWLGSDRPHRTGFELAKTLFSAGVASPVND